MFRNYFKTAWRNLWANRVYSFLNITGLAIGIAVCILILLFVAYERSFDNFHIKNIYRLNEVQKFEGMVSSQKVALSMFPMGPTLKEEFPEIKNYTRINRAEKIPLNYGEKRIYIDNTCFVDSTFLTLFDFKVAKGDRHQMLDKKNSIVLTQATAEKIFGKEDPLGKTLVSYDHDTTLLTVTGVMNNVPANSQIQFDALVPFSTIARPNWMDNWGGNWLNTYLELAPNSNVAALEKKFPDYLKKHLSADNVNSYQLFLLPLKEIHAGATDIGLDNFNYHQFDRRYTNIFFIIALIVLLIACVNFINLSTARSAERAREVGVRKSLGAARWQVSFQFISESVLISILALIAAVVLVFIFLPAVKTLSQRDLHFPLLTNYKLLLSILSGTIVVGIISGLYPAAYLSSFLPVKVLKGSVQVGKNKGLLRNMLVVGQFSCAIFLIIATVFVLMQLNFMKNRPTGFDKEQIVTIPFDRGGYRKFDALKKDLLQNSLVTSVTASQDILGSHLDQSGVQFKGDGPTRQLGATRLIVDHDYLTTYKMQLVAGKNFSPEKSAVGREYIINELLAKELLKDNAHAEFSSLLGKKFGFDSSGTIVGIVKDFNFNSLHHKIETLFIFNQNDWGFANMSVKINGGRPKEAISFIQSVWRKNCPDVPFEYRFLDEHFKELYKADSQVSTIVGTLAILAIIVSCLGLFGLASYSAERRFKEIGIRKVLGASVQGVVLLLSKQFMRLVLIANLIAWPIAWLVLDRWLQDYAYRINISGWVFVIAGIASLFIALITVSMQAIKAAIANPVKSLRSE
ncbi:MULTISPECIES: ABC transporter permease [Niastella]|uniref:ABC transporter permease n=1 Tax=Niastella soli TaxID=2821487 RepID=A0ABS3YRE3_9BACT|nr:ABC transporter permease [Niastella soli]MBO9200491.1 ABC transporter permease [Niastella soli]